MHHRLGNPKRLQSTEYSDHPDCENNNLHTYYNVKRRGWDRLPNFSHGFRSADDAEDQVY